MKNILLYRLFFYDYSLFISQNSWLISNIEESLWTLKNHLRIFELQGKNILNTERYIWIFNIHKCFFFIAIFQREIIFFVNFQKHLIFPKNVHAPLPPMGYFSRFPCLLLSFASHFRQCQFQLIPTLRYDIEIQEAMLAAGQAGRGM